MNKISIIFIISAFLFSCSMDKPFNQEGEYYRAEIDGKEIYLTFLQDSILAVNSDSLKFCSWYFMDFQKGKVGLFKTDELKIDTAWIKPIKSGVSFSGEDKNLIYNKIELNISKKDSLSREIEIVRGFKEKGISASCDYSFKEISYFYQKSIEKTKEYLKNPSSAKFENIEISREGFITWDLEDLDENTTRVTLNVQAKNGFGSFTENTYYVFFVPIPEDKTTYDISFSKINVLKYDD